MHYKTLAEILGSVYDLPSIYKKPSDSVYGILIKLSRHEHGGIKFLGKGIFVSEEVVIKFKAEEIVVQPSKVTPPKPKPRRILLMATCGDCRHAARSHMQIFASNLVTCNNSLSGREYPSKTDECCEHFSQTTLDEEFKAHKDRINMSLLIEACNFAVAISRRK